VDNNTIEVLDQRGYDQEKKNASAEQYLSEYGKMNIIFKDKFDSNVFNILKSFQYDEFNKLNKNNYKLISIAGKEQIGLYKKHPLKEDEYIQISCFNQYIIKSMTDDIVNICFQDKWEGLEIEIYNSKSEKYSFQNYLLEDSYNEKIIFNNNYNNENNYQSVFFDETFVNKIRKIKSIECGYKNKIFLGIKNDEYSMLESLKIKISRI
jgi:hypothetical protein